MIYMLIAIGGVQAVITTAIYFSISKIKKLYLLKIASLLVVSVSLFILISSFLLSANVYSGY